MTDQERREAVAAVPVHERQAEAAQLKVIGMEDKISKFENHLAGLENDLERARGELDAEDKSLAEVRGIAQAVLDDGPVTLSGHEVRALADAAGAAAEGRGTN